MLKKLFGQCDIILGCTYELKGFHSSEHRLVKVRDVKVCKESGLLSIGVSYRDDTKLQICFYREIGEWVSPKNLRIYEAY